MNDNQIEAGAEAIHHASGYDDYGVANECEREDSRDLARAAYAAFHPTITTAEELDALPVGSVIRASTDGSWVFERLSDGWFTPAIDSRMPHPLLPATVLHMGGAE